MDGYGCIVEEEDVIGHCIEYVCIWRIERQRQSERGMCVESLFLLSLSVSLGRCDVKV